MLEVKAQTPFDAAITDIERQPESIHRGHALTVLRSKAEGYRQKAAEDEMLLMHLHTLLRDRQ